MIFITGITGLLGSSIASALLAEGYKIKGLKRASSSYGMAAPFKDQVAWVEGDILDSLLLEKELAGCNMLVHCAAIVTFSPLRKTEMFQTNFEGTKNIVDCCLRVGGIRMLHISSVAAIGRSEEQTVIDENTKWVDGNHHSNYAVSKYWAELEVWRGIEEGLNAVIINPSVILGYTSDKSFRSSGKIFEYILNGGQFYTNGFINCVDIRDVTSLAVKLLLSDLNERFIVNSGVISTKELFATIAYALDKPAPKIKVGSIAAEIIWRIEYIRSLLSKSEPLITKESVRVAKSKCTFENDKIVKHFGWDFISVPDSLQFHSKQFLN